MALFAHGPELMSPNDNQWDQLCKYEEILFARTLPEQKLRIVKGNVPHFTKPELEFLLSNLALVINF